MGDDDWKIPFAWFNGASISYSFDFLKESEVNNKMEERNDDDINAQSIETLREELEGKHVLLKTYEELGIGRYDAGNYYGDIYINKEMYEYLGKVVTIDEVTYKGEYGKIIRLKGTPNWMFPVDAIAGIVTIKKAEGKGKEQQVEIGDRVKVVGEVSIGDAIIGDRTRCQTTKDIKFGIPIMELTEGIQPSSQGNKVHNKYEVCTGQELIVKDIKNGVIIPYYLNGEYPNDIIKVEDVEVVEKGYLDRIKNKQRKKAEEKEIIQNLITMDEMISKVNVKDFIKIYAGCVGKTPKDIQGIDLLLNQWAFNKRHLYLMLGRNLGISKEIESEKDGLAMKEDQQKLASLFPGAGYVIYDIPRDDFSKNELQRELYAGWMENVGKKPTYPKGTKVSKILNEAFNNEKMNIAYSDIVAESKMKGILEISIDPVEILLMSTNRSGWDSCHKISTGGRCRSWGGYSGGIFSYMCDSTSMIAFRHSTEKVTMKFWKNNIEINSKNWRQMIWVSKEMDIFVASRQYPAKSDETTQKARELLETTIDSYKKKKGETSWVHSKDQGKIKSSVADYNSYKHIGDLRTMHYNDMLQGYEGDLCYLKGKILGASEIIVGSNPACPICGKEIMNRNGYPMGERCEERL